MKGKQVLQKKKKNKWKQNQSYNTETYFCQQKPDNAL